MSSVYRLAKEANDEDGPHTTLNDGFEVDSHPEKGVSGKSLGDIILNILITATAARLPS